MKSVLWRVAKRVSYVEEARCLKVKHASYLSPVSTLSISTFSPQNVFVFIAMFLQTFILS